MGNVQHLLEPQDITCAALTHFPKWCETSATGAAFLDSPSSISLFRADAHPMYYLRQKCERSLLCLTFFVQQMDKVYLENQPKKRAGGCHSDEQVSPRRETTQQHCVRDSPHSQSERGRNLFRNPKQSDRHRSRGAGTCIASQPLSPGESIMSTRGPWQDS